VTRVRVQSFAISVDGYGAGANQSLENPLGINGPELMEWLCETRFWRRMHGLPDGETGIDNGIVERGFAGIGALRAGLIDELHVAIRPVLFGSGEHLLDGIDMRALGYECAESVAGERAMHVFFRKRA
jgi:RibD domain-containing protein